VQPPPPSPAPKVPPLPTSSTKKEHKEPAKTPLTARSAAPKLVGVGVRLTDLYPHCVAEFVRGGPAHKSGKIQVGDHLLAVDGEDIQKLAIAQIAAKIVGPEGSTLHLKFSRGHGAEASEFEIDLVRGSTGGNSTS